MVKVEQKVWLNSDAFLSFGDVQTRLIEAQRALWRAETGRWPFASDGPWQLVASDLYGPDVDKDVPLRPLPLTRAEIALTDEAVGWLTLVADSERRIVVLAIRELAKGTSQVPWGHLLRKMGLKHGREGLARRYDRAIGSICRAVNGGLSPLIVSNE